MGNATNRRAQNHKPAKSGNHDKRPKSDRIKGIQSSGKPKYKGKWEDN